MPTANIDELFESPDHLLLWCHEEIENFNYIGKRFLEHSNAYRLVVEDVLETGGRCVKMKQVKPMPVAIRGLAANIIKNLRDCLDQAASAASEAVSCKASNRTHFPFGENPTDLENSLSKRRSVPCKGIPVELYELFRRLQPYPTGNTYTGGDDVLRMLGRISGAHKHRVSLSVAPTDRESSWGGGGVGGMIKSENGCTFHTEGWDSKKNEMKLISVGAGGYIDGQFKVPLSICFADGPLKGVRAYEFFIECIDRVRNAINSLHAEAVKITQKARAAN